MEYYFKIADTCSIHKIAGYDQSFIVDQTNGCWCTFSNENINFVSAFIGKTVCSSDLHLNKALFSLLKTLFNQGILKINDETYFIEETDEGGEKCLTIIINTTNRCNLHCNYCYAYSKVKTYENFPSTSIIDDITKLVGNKEQQNISVVFHGGEPLLCWNKIIEMVIKLNDSFKNISYSIQTNGILVNKQIVDFAKSNKIKIGISLDGFNKQTNLNRFGEDKNDYLKKIFYNIGLLTHNGVETGILSVITKDNYRDLFNSVTFFTEKGVKHFGFNFLLSKGRGVDNDAEVSINELIDIYTRLACYINDYNAHHEPKDYISERTISVLIYSLSHKTLGACFATPCNAGKSLFALDVNGDVYPCDEFVGEAKFCIGNVRNADFSMQNIKSENIVNLKCRSVSSIEICKQCPIKKLCPFKCPSDSYYRTGNLFQPHSMCEFTKLILPKYMYLLQNNIISSKYFIFN